LALNHYASGVKNSGTKNQSVRASSVLAENRRARFDYEILETFEAGLELKGHEVKAIKAGRASLAGAHVVIRGNEAYLLNTEIAPYQALNTPKDHDPRRNRKLLIKKSEIKYLIGKNQTERLTTVPIKLYNKGGLVKVMIALVRSKKKHDKRETIKKRDAKREIERTLKRK
jgi:SsrA-binding protein